MTQFELFEKYRAKLPFAYTESDGFIPSINQILMEYYSDIKKLDEKLLVEKYEEVIKLYIDGIMEILNLSYQGLHALAFNKFKELMCDYRLSQFLQEKIENEKILYRMRIMENRTSVSFKDMFHIPLNKRGIIKTQRYSSPGYPCLYLGTTINACWEELHRPTLDNCMISALRLERTIKCIDLSLPNKKEIEKETAEDQIKLTRFFMNFPLILTCSVKVLNYSDTYKPEYIIPQLLMEYIIDYNKDKNYYTQFLFGIFYTSVHINNEFKYSDKEFINWAIPVLEPLSDSQYCPILSEHFTITDPTCDEFERIKIGNLTFLSSEPKSAYEASSFFFLENRLKHRDFFKIQ